jgi:hypothetical protein
LGSSEDDISTLRTVGNDPRSSIEICLTSESVNVDPDILQSSQNKVGKTLLLEGVDHDSCGKGGGEGIVFRARDRSDVVSVFDDHVDDDIDSTLSAPLVVLGTELEADRGLAQVRCWLLLNDLEVIIKTKVHVDRLVLLFRLNFNFKRPGGLTSSSSLDSVLEDTCRVRVKSNLSTISFRKINYRSIPSLKFVVAIICTVDTEVDDLTGSKFSLTDDASVGALLLAVPA